MSAPVLRIASGFSLPIEAVTDTNVIFGKKGSGKSNSGVVIAEECYRLHVPFCALDPVGHWWGMKSRPDGTPGLSLFVFGGPHADLPLEPTAGALMADVFLDTQKPMVLCTVAFSGLEKARFVTEFAERLLKRALVERVVGHLILEEADQFAPQKPFRGEERMLGAIDRLVRQIRQGGIGITMITQRSAAINKSVSNQADTLIAFRTLGPRDRDAIDSWIEYHEGGARRREVLESLATLKDGESWLWSPERLNYLGRVQWRRRETFDAAATPKVGQRVVQPRLADVDLEQLRTRMAATIERAKADDPRELRKRIAELERQVAQKTPAAPQAVEKILEVRILTDADIEALKAAVSGAEAFVDAILEKADRLQDAAGALGSALHTYEAMQRGSPAPGRTPDRPAQAVPPRVARALAAVVTSNGTGVSGPQQRILDALFRLESVRVAQPMKSQVALFAGASPRSSAFTNNLGALRTMGYIDYPTPGLVSLTPAGRARSNPVEVPVSTAELHAAVAELIGGAKWRILKPLLTAYPKSIDKAKLAELAGASLTSSAYTNNLGALRSLGFIDYPQRGYVAAEPVLFVEEAMVAAGGRR